MPLLPSVPGRGLGTGVGRVQVGCVLVASHGRARWQQSLPWAGNAAVGSQHGGCNLSGSHLLTVGWGSGPTGRGRLISSPLARALYFHFTMDLAGKWSTSETVEMGRSQLLDE